MSRFITCAAVLCLIVSGLPAAAAPVTLLSRADPDRPSGTPNGSSAVMGVSADARYVVFASSADNFLPGVTDANRSQDLFFHDRLAGTTVLISHAAGDPLTAGKQGAGDAVVSADGRWVAFHSDSTDLVAGQVDSEGEPGSSSAQDVFLWDRDTGLTTLVSHQAGLPTTAAGDCRYALGMSADGSRIAFESLAVNLVAGQSDAGSTPDLFLYDRADGTISLISHTSESVTTAAGGNLGGVLSADGSWVAFESEATGLVAGQIDTNGNGDIFLHEVATGTNLLVSHAAGTPATATSNAISWSARISADGSRIVFESNGTDLVAGVSDDNEADDVFLYDRATGANTLVSHTSSSATTTGDGPSVIPGLSADGRHVFFLSVAADLVPGVPQPRFELFTHDRITGINLMVSRDPMTPADGGLGWAEISSDGAWIAFVSSATNLVPGQVDVPSTSDTFLWSRAAGSISLVTHTPGSATTAAGGRTAGLRISADGSRIVLASTSSRLAADVADYNLAADVFVYERATGIHSLVTSRGGAASASAGGSFDPFSGPVMSNDGRYVAFNSAASNFSGVTSDENDGTDVFLADRVTGAVTLVSHASGSPATAADAPSYGVIVSADGTVVLFSSDASNLLSPPVSDAVGELYLYDRTTGGITLVSHAAGFPSAPASGNPIEEFHQYAVSGDGRWVAFTHTGVDLVAGQVEGNSGSDVFLFDRATGESTLISHAGSSPTRTGNSLSVAPSISADGRYVTFVSAATDLVSGAFFGESIFLYDRNSGTITRVGPSNSSPPALSADGRWVLFNSFATDVVPGQVDMNFGSDVFLWDRVSGSTILVSHTPASPTTTGNSQSDLSSLGGSSAALSADGRWAVFGSTATDLVSGQAGDQEGVFLFDRISGTVTLVSHSAASPAVNRAAGFPAISADGRFVTFASPAHDLVPGQMTSGQNHFLYDRLAGTTALVSHVPASEVTGGALQLNYLLPAKISADGAWVAFTSEQPDLVAGDHNGSTDVFLHGRPFGRDFFTLPPCRILDTRQAGQGPALTSGVKRMLTTHGSCGIPETARALAVNVTVVQPSAAGYLTFHAGDLAAETASTINFSSGQLRSNNAVLPLSFDGRGLLAVTPSVGGNGTVHLIVDVSGWFE